MEHTRIERVELKLNFRLEQYLEIKKPENKIFSGFLLKDWRRPTLAEPIELLPSARQRLTAVFGMGTGRTTAVMPPNYLRVVSRISRMNLGYPTGPNF